MITTSLLVISIAVASALGVLVVLGSSVFEYGLDKDIQIESATIIDSKTASPTSPVRGQVITLGTINDDAGETIGKFQPTADYLAKKLSNDEIAYTGQVVVARSMAEMIQKLGNNEVDVYYESPFATVAINEATGATAELLRWKNAVPEYHSIFVVRNDSPIQSIEDFKGRTIAFETLESTSSHLLPRGYLLKQGFQFNAGEDSIVQKDPPGSSLTYYFSGEDENTSYWVIEKIVDIGAMSNINYQEIPEGVKAELRIVAETENVPRHIVSFRSGLDPAVADQVKVILIAMESDTEGKEIMNDFQDTTRYSEIPQRETVIAGILEMLTLVRDDPGAQLPQNG